MSIDGQKDVDGLKRAGAAVAEARDTMGAHLAPGVSTAELDAIGREVLCRHGARSAPQLAYDFPGTTCISVNDELAHGIPSRRRVLCEGDLVSDAIAQVRAGAPIRNIGRAVERRAKRGGFRVVRDLCGHGGRASHRNLSSARR